MQKCLWDHVCESCLRAKTYVCYMYLMSVSYRHNFQNNNFEIFVGEIMSQTWNRGVLPMSQTFHDVIIEVHELQHTVTFRHCIVTACHGTGKFWYDVPVLSWIFTNAARSPHLSTPSRRHFCLSCWWDDLADIRLYVCYQLNGPKTK
jgi:hypothetical protein